MFDLPPKTPKNRYLMGFAIAVAILAIVRLAFPGVAGDTRPGTEGDGAATGDVRPASPENAPVIEGDAHGAGEPTPPGKAGEAADGGEGAREGGDGAFPLTRFFDDDMNEVRHRILGVPDYGKTFPDGQDLQVGAATRLGVSPVQNRDDAEARKSELVFVGASPYYHVDPLRSSIPYLVPRAAVLLSDMGRAFFDSLQVKGIPLHQIIVTSALRTKDDVSRLRGFNGNATENSCHLYGTTFDIGYNRYKTVSDPDGPPRREVRNDTLKWVLSEVLRDLRANGRCYVKYERKQGCFHITAR